MCPWAQSGVGRPTEHRGKDRYAWVSFGRRSYGIEREMELYGLGQGSTDEVVGLDEKRRYGLCNRPHGLGMGSTAAGGWETNVSWKMR